MKIKGTVTYQDFEGGFWGIVDSDGNKYVPIDRLPESVRKDGQKVTADVESVHMLGTVMWGTHVKITSIAPA
jgi:hypothetical protein